MKKPKVELDNSKKRTGGTSTDAEVSKDDGSVQTNLSTEECIDQMLQCGMEALEKDEAVEPCSSSVNSRDEMVKFADNSVEPRTSRSVDEITRNADENKAKKGKSKFPKNCLKQIGKLFNSDKTLFIKSHQIVNPHPGNLPYSARFLEGGTLWRLYGENGLLVSTNKYVAQVTIEPLDALDRADTFNSAKQILLENLKVTKVLLDVQLEDVQNAKTKYDSYSKAVFANTIDDQQNAEDLFQLESILRRNKLDERDVITEIRKNPFISENSKKIITEYIEKESKHASRWTVVNMIQSLFGSSKTRSCIDALRENVAVGIRNHKAEVMKLCPDILKCHLVKMNDNRVLLVTRKDLKLFSDFINTFDKTVLDTTLPTWIKRYIDSIHKINTNQLKSVLPLTNPVIYYISKSWLDVSEEIATKTVTKTNLRYDPTDGWSQIGEIDWKTTPSTLDKGLECQMKLLIKLFNHFEVGKRSSSQNFPYKYKVFGTIESSQEFQHVIAQANKAFERQYNQSASVLPAELYVWICLLDDTIAHLFSDNRHIVKMCTALLKPYLNYSLSGQLTVDSLESLRVITHNTIRIVSQAGSFVKPQNERDNDILMKQVGFMSRGSLEGRRMSFADYRDLIEVFAQFWGQRSDAIEGLFARLPGEGIKQHVEDIQSLLLQCMAGALDKNVQMTEIVNFCRAYEELVTDLQNLSLDWYVRMPSAEYIDIFVKKEVLTMVDNKWKDSDRQCYCVKDVVQFIKLYQALYNNEDEPRHFLVESIKMLLKTIVNMESKARWSNGPVLTAPEQLKATGLLIASVRSSLLYLKEQPDYVSFDRFLEESIKPFTTVCDESSSFDDFEKRVLLIKESFWYIRNLNAIDIDTALKLFQDNNTCDYNEVDLRKCYQAYHKQFEQFMAIDGELSTKIQRIVETTSQLTGDFLTLDWTVEFKQETLPAILAGLSAVWAMHVSKDVASSGQYLKPHCIQILCVARLLSADKVSQGVRNHLAQVLTGQGKSLVLALVAAVLAFCGHNVEVMCYSEYLAKRDEQDFKEFFELFEIQWNVKYKTFEEAAGDYLNVVAGNAEKYVHSCIGLPKAYASYRTLQPNSVLLIDEVDVFFDEKLYGESRGLGSFPVVPGLDQIQILIWSYVKQKHSNVRQLVDNFINNSNCKDIAEFTQLMKKIGRYSLLQPKNDKSVIEQHSNMSLFSSHIDEIISTAQAVNNMKRDDNFLSKCRLNDSGDITYRTDFGNYSASYKSYYLSFIYFRLKKSNFDERKSNYGYFDFHLGSTSYAKLPENYSLILGVSGTLTTLSNYEKTVVKDRYHISELSVMPSFFGGTNLKFHESNDFSCFNTVTDWMNAIFGRINAIISAKRSVLVIFDADVTINAFKQQFAGQLDRLNVLTVDSSPQDKERFIADAGVCRTITLATREMGRGVDYKSSVAVEKNGGVHVIQSFFSVDVKEETQIKGRTARKDNRGSYELIVCIKHLREENLVESIDQLSSVSYSRLNASRTRQVTINDAARDEQLRKANEMHDLTVEFYKNK